MTAYNRKCPVFIGCAVYISGTLPPCAKEEEHTPRCANTCEQGYSISYKQDKHFGDSAYSLRTVEAIQQEIMTNGPIEGTMEVYADFPSYKSGENITV